MAPKEERVDADHRNDDRVDGTLMNIFMKMFLFMVSFLLDAGLVGHRSFLSS